MNFSKNTNRPPDVSDILDASNRIANIAVCSPLLESDRLNARVNARVFLKCEMFQPVGAFKIRGAWNFMSRLTNRQLGQGVVAFSSGNHAQAVAWAARKLQTPATIVMPSDAPKVKINKTREYGAGVVLYDRNHENREEIAGSIAARKGAILIPPYDHAHIIAGQGTVGLEIVKQCRKADIVPDLVLVPCSGGGLISGCSIVLKDAFPHSRIFSVEPEGFDDTARSLKAGKLVENLGNKTSICDALLVRKPGNLTFEINRKNLDGGVVVTDDEVRQAIATAFSDTGLVTEPGGAVGLAAILVKKVDCAGKVVCVVLSGGNADPSLYSQILSSRLETNDRN
ncbi:MAG: threonine/serine dehydratase [Pseudomonadota bacterium]|nr:threonine/serine dehydratase [Pseudomonadota bacterium]